MSSGTADAIAAPLTAGSPRSLVSNRLANWRVDLVDSLLV